MVKLRLLTANLCMISPGGCVRLAVPLGLMGIVFAVLLLLLLPPLRAGLFGGPSFLGAACALYAVEGVRRCKGTIWGASIAFLCVFGYWRERYLLTGALAAGGYIFLALAPCAQLITSATRRLRPDLIYDAQSERLKLFCSLLESYDIVCLQEVTTFWGRDGHAADIRAAGAKHGLQHFCSSGLWPVWPSTFATNGLCVLSRFPITKTRNFTFSMQSWFEWSFVQRGAFMAELEGPGGGKIAVLNAHTTSGVEVLESGVGRRPDAPRENPMGLSQLLEVLEAFAEFSEGASQKIFCGDFNLPKHSLAFHILQARANALGLHDCFPDSPPTFGCDDEPREALLTKVADRGNPKVLDHVFSDQRCASARVEKMEAPQERWHEFQQVSDHRAVAVCWE